MGIAEGRMAADTGRWPSDGGVFSFGTAEFYGLQLDSAGGASRGINSRATRERVLAGRIRGGVFAFGDARYYGSMAGEPLNSPVVGMSATPDGGGYG